MQAGRLAPIDVARVVKKLEVRAGLAPVKYAGHSPPAGYATAAAIAGASECTIMKQTGTGAFRWSAANVPLLKPFRDHPVLEDNRGMNTNGFAVFDTTRRLLQPRLMLSASGNTIWTFGRDAAELLHGLVAV